MKNSISRGSTSAKLNVDDKQAKRQLELLGYLPGDVVQYREFRGKALAQNVVAIPRKFSLRFPNIPHHHGATVGLYFAVNGGQRKEEVSDCRALFADSDADPRPPELYLAFIKEMGLPEPTLVLQSRNGYHVYWALETSIQPQLATELQKDLAERIDGDRSIHDPNRVMRLGGSWHIQHGAEPFRCNLVYEADTRYTLSELREAIPPRQGKHLATDAPRELKQLMGEVYARLTPEQIFSWDGHQFTPDSSKQKYRGCCPWHKSTSGTAFYIDWKDNQWLWRCPKCEIGGDAIAYRRKLQGTDFKQAVNDLVSQAGLKVDWQQVTPSTQADSFERYKAQLEAISTLSDELEISYQTSLLANEFGFSSTKVERDLKRLTQAAKDDSDDCIVEFLDTFLVKGDAEIDWVIEKLIAQGQSHQFTGQTKAGKTQLALDLAYSVATGVAFLGKVPQHTGRVLFFSSDRGSKSDRIKLGARGFDTKANVGVIKDWKLNQLARFEKFLTRYRPILIIIDSLRSSARGCDISENSAEFADLLGQVVEISDRHNVTSVILHHANKSKDNQGFEKSRGSSGIPAVAWSHWSLTRPRGSSTVKVHIQCNDSEESEFLIEADNRNHYAIVTSEMAYDETVDVEAQTVESKSAMDQIYEFLVETAPTGYEVEELAEQLGLSYKTVRNKLSLLVESNKVSKRPSETDHKRKVYFAKGDASNSRKSKTVLMPQLMPQAKLSDEAGARGNAVPEHFSDDEIVMPRMSCPRGEIVRARENGDSNSSKNLTEIIDITPTNEIDTVSKKVENNDYWGLV